jgi:hypothetical protein
MRFRIVNQAVKAYMLQVIQSVVPSEDSPMVVSVKEEGRSLDQNAAMWPILEAFATQKKWVVNGKECYLTADDWKDILTAAFKKETNRIATGIDGGLVILGMRTSKMGKKEFSEFLEFLHATAAEMEIELLREAA